MLLAQLCCSEEKLVSIRLRFPFLTSRRDSLLCWLWRWEYLLHDGGSSHRMKGIYYADVVERIINGLAQQKVFDTTIRLLAFYQYLN